MSLSDAKVKTAKPGRKAYYLFDGGGMYLHVAPSGGKWWRLKYRFGGKEKRMSLGVYPDVGLKKARQRRTKYREQLADGIDPARVRASEKQAQTGTFEQVAREWHETFQSGWVPSHADRILMRLNNDVFPWIGHRPLAEVTAPEVLECLRRIEARGARESAHRVLSTCGQVFRYAVATGRTDSDPSRDLRGALSPPLRAHLAAVVEPSSVRELLVALRSYEGVFTTKCALRLAPLVFVRPVELRSARWEEIDWEHAQWNIPALKMKGGEPHIVPLATQSMEILGELFPLTGSGTYVFPSLRTGERPMSENTINAALRRLGYPKEIMTGHGFRAMARTLLDEQLGIRPDYIEHQLAHTVRDPLGRAYNRTKHLNERRAMMQTWADYLDGLTAQS